jgi:hypothetical protein
MSVTWAKSRQICSVTLVAPPIPTPCLALSIYKYLLFPMIRAIISPSRECTNRAKWQVVLSGLVDREVKQREESGTGRMGLSENRDPIKYYQPDFASREQSSKTVVQSRAEICSSNAQHKGCAWVELT